ncbi:MAG: hypothetical protein GYB65_01910 [Chloroflexi bacterium]|nr:hypothetical protein [Chloroflexota bacterium]
MAQVELDNTWITHIPPHDVRPKLEAFLRRYHIRIKHQDENQITGTHGLPLAANVLGSRLVKPGMWPKQITIRLEQTPAGMQLHVKLEDLSTSHMLARRRERYYSYFVWLMNALKAELPPAKYYR